MSTAVSLLGNHILVVLSWSFLHEVALTTVDGHWNGITFGTPASQPPPLLYLSGDSYLALT